MSWLVSFPKDVVSQERIVTSRSVCSINRDCQRITRIGSSVEFNGDRGWRRVGCKIARDAFNCLWRADDPGPWGAFDKSRWVVHCGESALAGNINVCCN